MFFEVLVKYFKDSLADEATQAWLVPWGPLGVADRQLVLTGKRHLAPGGITVDRGVPGLEAARQPLPHGSLLLGIGPAGEGVHVVRRVRGHVDRVVRGGAVVIDRE